MLALAVAHEALLRHIAEHGRQAMNVDLGRQLGKDASNLRRDAGKLVEAGLLDEPDPADDAEVKDYGLTEAGLRALQALDVGAGRTQIADGHTTALHGEIGPRPDLNPRRDFDPDEIDELRQSILTKGLLQGLVVRPADGADSVEGANPVRFWIVAGERRWRAIGEAIAEGDWPQDQPIPVAVRAMDDAEHRRLAFAENVQRVDLNPVELARAYQAEIDAGRSTADIADDANKTREHVQQHLRILKLDPVNLDALAAGAITFRQARDLVAQPKPKAPEARTEDPPRDDEPPAPPFEPTPAQQLMLVELAEKVRRDPVAKFRSGFTPVDPQYQTDGDFAALATANAVAVREIAGLHEARIIPHGVGASWLWANTYNPELEAQCLNLLAIVRRRALGVTVPASEHFVTPWLNTEARIEGDAALAGEPTQPDLVPPTAEEASKIDARELANRAGQRDAEALQDFGLEMRTALANMARQAFPGQTAGHLANWRDQAFPKADLADEAIALMAGGKAVKAAVVLMMLRTRCGAIGVEHELRRAAERQAERQVLAHLKEHA